MEEMEQTKFARLLENAILHMTSDPKTAKFSQYFQQTYAVRYEQWAFCFRKAAGINTNMYAESFHRVLKYVYMKGNINKRLDSIIHLVMKYARDKAFDRIMKVEKGKLTRHTRTINDRHKKSLELHTSNIR